MICIIRIEIHTGRCLACISPAAPERKPREDIDRGVDTRVEGGESVYPQITQSGGQVEVAACKTPAETVFGVSTYLIYKRNVIICPAAIAGCCVADISERREFVIILRAQAEVAVGLEVRADKQTVGHRAPGVGEFGIDLGKSVPLLTEDIVGIEVRVRQHGALYTGFGSVCNLVSIRVVYLLAGDIGIDLPVNHRRRVKVQRVGCGTLVVRILVRIVQACSPVDTLEPLAVDGSGTIAVEQESQRAVPVLRLFGEVIRIEIRAVITVGYRNGVVHTDDFARADAPQCLCGGALEILKRRGEFGTTVGIVSADIDVTPLRPESEALGSACLINVRVGLEAHGERRAACAGFDNHGTGGQVSVLDGRNSPDNLYGFEIVGTQGTYIDSG